MSRHWFAGRNRHGVRGFYRDQWWTQLNIGGWEVGYCRSIATVRPTSTPDTAVRPVVSPDDDTKAAQTT